VSADGNTVLAQSYSNGLYYSFDKLATLTNTTTVFQSNGTMNVSGSYLAGVTSGNQLQIGQFVGAPVVCFLAGTPVLTPAGYKPIEEIAEGENVLISDGRTVKVMRKTANYTFPCASNNPYVIPAGQYGATTDIYVSPRHRIQTENGFVEARFLNLQQVDMTAPWLYYNLQVENWFKDHLVVGGVVTESLAPLFRVKMSLPAFAQQYLEQTGNVLEDGLYEKIKRNCEFTNDGQIMVPIVM